MSVLVYPDAGTCGKVLSTLVASALIENPYTNVGLMYDSILSPFFHSLSDLVKENIFSLEKARLYQLCEFVPPDELSVSLKELLFGECLSVANISDEQYVVPYAKDKNWAQICSDFEADILEHGGLDISILALRPDGSLLYNLPSGELAPITHVERIGENRIVCAGVATVLHSKKIYAVATGSDCAEAVQKTLRNTISDADPTSLLQLHQNVTFIFDEQAAALL